MTKTEALDKIASPDSDSAAIADGIGDYSGQIDKDEAICKLRMMLLNLSRHLNAEQMRESWRESCGDFHGFGV